jgi:hypothetical protein
MAQLRLPSAVFAFFSLVSCANKTNDGSVHPDTSGPIADSGADAARPPATRVDAGSTSHPKPPRTPDTTTICKDDPGPTTSAESLGKLVLPWKVSLAATAVPEAGSTPAPSSGVDVDAGRATASDAGPGAASDAGGTTASDAGRTTASDAGCSKLLPAVPWAGGSDVRCRGWAAVRRTDSDLELRFADGSTLSWDPELVRVVIAAPDVRNGDAVWVDYTSHTIVVCPFCGERVTTDLQIRRDEDGPILWMGREGSHDYDVDESMVRELFGVSARSLAACKASGIGGGCFKTDRWLYDHVLETDPEQTIVRATVEHVVTPGGAYDVFWTHTDSSVTFDPMCYDGPEPSEDNTFAISRTAN